MSHPHFIHTAVNAGVWEGTLAGAGTEAPVLKATHDGQALPDIALDHDAVNGVWHVRIPLPSRLINEDLQVVVITDGAGHRLGHFSVLAGDLLSEDLRAEIALLRAEVDMLKSALRKQFKES